MAKNEGQRIYYISIYSIRLEDNKLGINRKDKEYLEDNEIYPKITFVNPKKDIYNLNSYNASITCETQKLKLRMPWYWWFDYDQIA